MQASQRDIAKQAKTPSDHRTHSAPCFLMLSLTACGFLATERYSSHSLRSGFATEASRRKASLTSIMRQGRWKKVDTLMHYVQEGQRFDDNAAATVMAGVEAENK